MEQNTEYIIKGKDWSKLESNLFWNIINSREIPPTEEADETDLPKTEMIETPTDEGTSQTDLLKTELDRYFVYSNGYGNSKFTPLNLGIYYDKDLELYSSQYVGVMPLIDKHNAVCPGKYLSIQSRFPLSPMEMLYEVMNGMDYYENPGMLSYKEYTVKELLDSKNFSEEKRVLFGVLKDAGKISSPKSTNADGAVSAAVDLMVGTEHSVFEVLRFVSLAKELCKKSLKKQSQTVEENLNGKVKGRILINKQIKYNLSKGQYHKTYCAYNSMQDNTPENRIIKYTLHLCSKFPIADTLNEDIMFCNRVLAKVPLQQCTTADFVGLKSNGAFKLYKEVLALAKVIHEKYFISYEKGENGEKQEKVCAKTGGLQIEPFFIDMNLLFEYYCRALFRKALDKYNNNLTQTEQTERLYLEPGNQKKSLFKEDSDLNGYYMHYYIPDILVKYKSDEKTNRVFLVADAKYSNVATQDWKKRARTHQVLFYMNALQSNIGGLVGFDDQENRLIREPYLVDGKEKGGQELFFLPISPVKPEDKKSVSDQYVEIIQGALKNWNTKNAKYEQEKKRYAEIERISRLVQPGKKLDQKLQNELLALFNTTTNSYEESKR